jgi:hypothetical protein
MEITINTINGMYIVPREKADALISWLQQNAIKQSPKAIGEVKIGEYSQEYLGRQLINE